MAWDIDQVGAPWAEGRQGIFGFISERVDADGSLGDHPPDLPDVVRDPNKVSFSPGSLDGISRHFGVGAPEAGDVDSIIAALKKLSHRESKRNASKLYDKLSEAELLPLIDEVLERLTTSGLDPERVRAIGRWLARSAPDQPAVKFGLALLGMVAPPDNDTMLTLGAHDGFTLYAAVGLKNAGGNDRDLYDLARRVHGWGRIEVVERLAETTDPEIKEWLVREGYQNAVTYEYLAQICATAGDLAERLAADEVDEELLASAGELLEAIATGQPGPPTSDYADAPLALDRYLRHISLRTGTLADRRIVKSIQRVLNEPDEVNLDDPERSRLLAIAEQFVNRDHFAALVPPALLAEDSNTYWNGKHAAIDLGIDIYDAIVERIERSLDEHTPLFDLMQATTPERIDRSLDLGRRMIDVSSIATGPSQAIGMGPEFKAHMDLGWFLQGLKEYPGKGWDLVHTGLQSPSIQNRNWSLRVLQHWERDAWPPDAEAALQKTIEREVDARVRALATDVLNGDVALDEAWGRTLDALPEHGADLIPLARRLAASPPGARLRSEASYSTFVLWNGPYDSSAYEQPNLLIGKGDDGFNITLSAGMGETVEQHLGLTEAEAESKAADLMNRLVQS